MNDNRLTAHVVTKLLDQSTDQISPEIQARLNLAIAKSVQLHAEKQDSKAKPQAIFMHSIHCFMQKISNWFSQPSLSIAASALFIAIGVLGAAQFGIENYDARISETADLDAAILSDDLPPDAYLDPGFINYATELQKNNSMPAEDGIEQWIEFLPIDFTTSI